jgi:hypothetical protein
MEQQQNWTAVVFTADVARSGKLGARPLTPALGLSQQGCEPGQEVPSRLWAWAIRSVGEDQATAAQAVE